MTAQQFSEALSALSVSNCQPRIDMGFKRIDDPLLNLITNYDTDNLESGGLEFYPFPRRYHERIGIASHHGDEIVMLPNGTIVLEEAGRPGHVMAEVAIGSDQFLDAMLIVCRHFALSVSDGSLRDDINETRRIAAAAAVAAGGKDRFLGFYETLVGCD